MSKEAQTPESKLESSKIDFVSKIDSALESKNTPESARESMPAQISDSAPESARESKNATAQKMIDRLAGA